MSINKEATIAIVCPKCQKNSGHFQGQYRGMGGPVYNVCCKHCKAVVIKAID